MWLKRVSFFRPAAIGWRKGIDQRKKRRRNMTPIKLKAPLKDYLWGGTRLKTDFGKKTDLEKVAESWELSCHKDGPSVVASGEDQGLTLPEYIEKHGKRILGTHGSKFQDFPILIKLIDAKDNLSIQVHPDNEFALRVEGEYGKTEMWYIVDCEPGATCIMAFKRRSARRSLRSGSRTTPCWRF